MAFFQDWLDKMYETFIETGHYELMIQGLGNTVKITLGALVIGVVIGTIVAAAKFLVEDRPGLKFISWLCDTYVTVIRGIPVVVLLLIFFFIILTSADGITVAMITFGINSGAYMAELIRSGINAVDKGQTEAGRCLGLSKLQTMVKIIMPQAVRYIMPAVGNEFIALLKETSVAGYVAVIDLTRAGSLIRNNTYDSVNSLLVVALSYLVMVIFLTAIFQKVEQKLAAKN